MFYADLCFPDHVPREVVEQWLKYFRGELPTVAFKCNLQEQQKNSGKKLRKDSTNGDLLQTSNCLGGETLLKLLKNYYKNQKVSKLYRSLPGNFGNVFIFSVPTSYHCVRVFDLNCSSC